MIRRPVAWITVGMAALLVGGVTYLQRPATTLAVVAGDSALGIREPLPRRVTVEVLNATGTTGLARTATVRLRDAGLDVVNYGGADAAQRATGLTLILIRRGDTTGVGRVRELYPTAVVRDDPLESRLVDLSVVLGPDASIQDLP